MPARPAAPEFSRIGVEKLRKPGSAQPEQIAGRKLGFLFSESQQSTPSRLES